MSKEVATLKFIDLFSGIGGIRLGFEMACDSLGIKHKCVFSSEIKTHAIKILNQNFDDKIHGDITKISSSKIPNFDFLLAGFPCQAFSSAGKRLGFNDTRGTLFFEVARILKDKKPFGFLLENVEGLVNHNNGKTLETILNILNSLGYKTTWSVLNSKNFGVAQERKRIYILGTKKEIPKFEKETEFNSNVGDILEHIKCENSEFAKLILKHFKPNELYGKAIKDKRGGNNNIHAWDIEYKGKVTALQKKLLDTILKERRKKKWAIEYGIDWMDGMPLTFEHIKSFFNVENLQEMLDDLVKKGYLKLEYPKKLIGNKRIQDTTLPIGYNIVSGKMSYEINKILDPNDVAPTFTATDMQRICVIDKNVIRPISLREGLRLFGYPDSFKFNIEPKLGYDLLGNTVVVPLIKSISKSVLNIYKGAQ